MNKIKDGLYEIKVARNSECKRLNQDFENSKKFGVGDIKTEIVRSSEDERLNQKFDFFYRF